MLCCAVLCCDARDPTEKACGAESFYTFGLHPRLCCTVLCCAVLCCAVLCCAARDPSRKACGAKSSYTFGSHPKLCCAVLCDQFASFYLQVSAYPTADLLGESSSLMHASSGGSQGHVSRAVSSRGDFINNIHVERPVVVALNPSTIFCEALPVCVYEAVMHDAIPACLRVRSALASLALPCPPF